MEKSSQFRQVGIKILNHCSKVLELCKHCKKQKQRRKETAEKNNFWKSFKFQIKTVKIRKILTAVLSSSRDT